MSGAESGCGHKRVGLKVGGAKVGVGGAEMGVDMSGWGSL